MKSFKITIVFMIIALCLFGCSSKESKQEEVTTNTNETTTQETIKEEPKEMGMMGSISEIDVDNSKITISTMNNHMPNGEKPSGEFNKDNIPEGMEEFDPNNKPEGNENFNPENAPEGKEEFNPEDMKEFNPKDKPEGMEIPNSETVSTTYNVIENTIIKDADGNEITISDLKVDDFISYTLDGENLLTISIVDMNNKQK